MVELFELGSVHHEFYAINIRLGESDIVQYMNFAESAKNLYLTSELPEVRLVLTVKFNKNIFSLYYF